MNVSQARKGFTLIELLVVLTILGLLAALLFPVFLNARERGRQAVCASNLHQIGLAIQMYQGDYSGVLPEMIGDATSIPADERVGGQGDDDLSPYEHSPDIYHCLDRRSPLPTPGTPYLRDDYGYRVPFLMQFQKENGQPEAVMKPSPTSVLAYDDNHPPYRDGSYIVLRADGSVSRVSIARVAEWYYLPNGQWTQGTPDSLFQMPVFPGEPWPPQFEKLGSASPGS